MIGREDIRLKTLNFHGTFNTGDQILNIGNVIVIVNLVLVVIVNGGSNTVVDGSVCY